MIIPILHSSHDYPIPKCSMVLEYLPTFTLKITKFCRFYIPVPWSIWDIYPLLRGPWWTQPGNNWPWRFSGAARTTTMPWVEGQRGSPKKAGKKSGKMHWKIGRWWLKEKPWKMMVEPVEPGISMGFLADFMRNVMDFQRIGRNIWTSARYLYVFCLRNHGWISCKVF